MKYLVVMMTIIGSVFIYSLPVSAEGVPNIYCGYNTVQWQTEAEAAGSLVNQKTLTEHFDNLGLKNCIPLNWSPNVNVASVLPNENSDNWQFPHTGPGQSGNCQLDFLNNVNAVRCFGDQQEYGPTGPQTVISCGEIVNGVWEPRNSGCN